MLHPNVISKCYIQMLHPNVTPKCYTQMLHPNVTPKCYIQMLHPNVTSKSYIQILHPNVTSNCYISKYIRYVRTLTEINKDPSCHQHVVGSTAQGCALVDMIVGTSWFTLKL